MRDNREASCGSPTSGPRWRRRREARPTEITRAALEVFSRKGFAATRVQDIARQAGVSSGTIYLYFDGKEEVLKAAVRESMVAVLSRAEDAAVSHQGTGDELLRETLSAWFRSMVGDPASGVPKLMLAEAANFPGLARFYLDEVVDRARRNLRTMLDRGATAGEFRRLDPRFAIPLIIAPLVWFFLWQGSVGAFDDEHLDGEPYLEACIDLLLDGLRPREKTGTWSNVRATGEGR